MTGARPTSGLRPARVCAELLEALAASEGRSRRRKRDQRPDAIGLGIKRTLLEAAVRDDPEPDGFEEWLHGRVLAGGPGSGAIRAMALQIFEEWRLAQLSDPFRGWLAGGAPSADREPGAPADPHRV
jgi:hypothetical protein